MLVIEIHFGGGQVVQSFLFALAVLFDDVGEEIAERAVLSVGRGTSPCCRFL